MRGRRVTQHSQGATFALDLLQGAAFAPAFGHKALPSGPGVLEPAPAGDFLRGFEPEPARTACTSWIFLSISWRALQLPRGRPTAFSAGTLQSLGFKRTNNDPGPHSSTTSSLSTRT